MNKSLKSRHKLKFKTVIFILILGVILNITVIPVVSYFWGNELRDTLLMQGVLLGKSLSIVASEKLIARDTIGLKKLVEKFRHYPNIEYVIIEDFDRQIITDTYNGKVPDALIGINRFERNEATDFFVTEAVFSKNQKDVKILDVLIPVEEGLMGFIRIGVRKAYITDKIRSSLFLISAIILGGTLFAILVMLYFIRREITEPVISLTRAAENISLGNFNISTEVKVNNELKVLADAIDRMQESLKTCMEKLKYRQMTRI